MLQAIQHELSQEEFLARLQRRPRVRLGRPAGELLAERLEREELFAPELLDAEVLAVLRRAVHTAELGEDRAETAVTDLADRGLRRLPHILLVRKAWEFRHDVSAYDALYLAAGHLYDAPVLTADGLLSRAPTPGVLVENIRV